MREEFVVSWGLKNGFPSSKIHLESVRMSEEMMWKRGVMKLVISSDFYESALESMPTFTM